MPRPAPQPRPLSTGQRLLLALAGAHVLLMLGVVLARIAYPFELEWMEGAMVDHVRRLLAGQPLYAQPSVEFVSFNYPPLYYAASAGLARLLGPGMLPLRIVSFASSLVCLALLFHLVRRETGSPRHGFLAAALFAASWRAGGSWFDIARVDMLALALSLAAVALLRQMRSPGSALAAGALLGLAFLTKQLALLFLAPLLAWLAWSEPRRGLPAAGAALLVGGGGTLLLAGLHPQWYLYHVFEIPRRLKFLPKYAGDFWVRDIFGVLGIAALVGSYFVIRAWRSERRSGCVFYLALLAGLLGASWAARLPVGGYNNVLLPAYAGVALLFGLGLHRAEEDLAAAGPRATAGLPSLAAWACVLQLALLLYNPASMVPSRESFDAGWRLVRRMSQERGDVLIPYHGYLAAMAGKPAHAHWIAVLDVMKADREGEGRRLEQALEDAFRRQRFSVVILDGSRWLADVVERHYRLVGPAFDKGDEFLTVTGLATRPEYVYVPKEEEPR